MQIEILGSGGATITPLPGDDSPMAEEARTKGVPYSRSGPSVFLHGPDLLIDTPEESAMQLNRSRIGHVAAGTYSHWHPDHVMGRRVWEALNMDFRNAPPQNRTTPIYLPERVGEDFRKMLGLWQHFRFFAEEGIIDIVELKDGDGFTVGPARVTPMPLAAAKVYAFLVQEGARRALIVMDETQGWVPPPAVRGVDVAILPMGVADFHPLTGECQFYCDNPVWRDEPKYPHTLELVRQLAAGQVVLSHIEAVNNLSYDDLCEMERRLQRDGLPVRFAYDTMTIDL